VQGKDSFDNDLILYDNLTQIFIMLYKKLKVEITGVLNSPDKLNSIREMGYDQNSYSSKLISIVTILFELGSGVKFPLFSELYNSRVDSHAFTHNNDLIYEIFHLL
jgi:hypothetical protein